uniref:Caspase 8 n=1 Tax=Corbicula fluminea TaxID=45949 RepID=A0A1P8SNM7_CORFM|nr:caspase 8 [Corbicula fluminea]
MPPRMGTERDAQSLQYIFEKLGFIVRRRDNMKETEMMSYLIDIAHNVDHRNFDCFVCCILTHGVLGYLYGSNGRLISIKDLTATFQANRCQTLAGKPKLFFIQACQGRDKMEGGHIEKDMPTPMSPDTDNEGGEMIPNEADFLLGYATVPGYVSFRSRNHGSWYIRKLCELLDKYFKRYDLMSILVEVNREVAHANASMDGGLFKQIPAPLVTLRKQLYFR